MVATDLRDTRAWIAGHDPLSVVALTDEVIDRLGHDVGSGHVETYWLPILGPSAIWAARRLVDWLDTQSDGVEIPLESFGRSLGLGGGEAPNSPVVRTLARVVDFGMARHRRWCLRGPSPVPATHCPSSQTAAGVSARPPPTRDRGGPMTTDTSSAEIEEGGDGRGSHLAPPEPGCGCAVQTPAQISASQNACTTITLVGARGGAGTRTIAAVLALTGRTIVRTELVAHEPDVTAALLGAGLPVELPGEIVPDLTLRAVGTGGAELCIVDAGTLTKATSRPSAPGERRICVVRGPCYLALRTLLADDYGLDGIVLLTEPGRALTRRDVTDVTGLEIIATVPVTQAVARCIDAGLLTGRLDRMSEFRQLRRWLTGLLDPFPPRSTATGSPAPNDTPMSGTDLLLALCASS